MSCIKNVDNSRKILFVVNKTKSPAEAMAQKLASLAQKNGILPQICADFPVPDSAFKGKDICCVIGGDGTILSCVQSLVKYSLPVFGINLGKLGFLATYTEEIDDESFLALANGNFHISERALLKARYQGKNYYALNDFVFKDLRVAGNSDFQVFADSELVADYVGDGLIFSTPTGSTAYNLSAGGPLLSPKARAFVMTPICPHTLSNRSLVFDYGAQIRIVCLGGENALIADGREVATIKCGAKIELEMPALVLKFARLSGDSYFRILRNKLGWAEDPRRHISQ